MYHHGKFSFGRPQDHAKTRKSIWKHQSDWHRGSTGIGDAQDGSISAKTPRVGGEQRFEDASLRCGVSASRGDRPSKFSRAQESLLSASH